MTTLTKKQTRELSKTFTENGREYVIVAEVRHDDSCGNGHNTFAITGSVYRHPVARFPHGTIKSEPIRCGCIHEEIAEHFPELQHLIRWHLCSTDGPLHYVANTLYLAGDRDCWGLQKGQVNATGRVGEGKERELDAARRSAIWPEATDEELMDERLRGRLEDRLPALMAEFQRDIEAFGFTY
jgi:hypothetical protein